SRSRPALVIAALTGTIAVEANESGPITSLEQAMIPQAARTPLERNRAFARYNAVAYLAGSLGALAAGGPDFFRRFFPAVPASQRFLLAYPAVGLACAFLASKLSRQMESGEELTAERKFPLIRSKRRVAGLAGFAIGQMDVPARQAYVVAIVDPGERTAAASYTNTARYVVRPAGPALGGYLMQTFSLSAPLVAAGALKVVYDFTLLATFRRV